MRLIIKKVLTNADVIGFSPTLFLRLSIIINMKSPLTSLEIFVRNWSKITFLGLLIVPIGLIARELPSPEEMWAVIQKQQEQIAQLSDRVEAAEARYTTAETQLAETANRIAETDAMIETTTAFVETLADQSGSSGGNAWYDRTSLGGYGEMHLQMGSDGEIDFHRWVLFIGHEFTDSVRMFSEFELEHSLAGDGKPGEVELEQAYIEFDLDEMNRAKAGLFLLPVGLLNETHEPATFFGVERNTVEKNIIPTTWWEGGVGLTHVTAEGWSFDGALHSGLSAPVSGSKAFNIRSGRQKVAKASFESGAATMRARYSGIPGLDLAVSAQYQQDLAQGALAQSIDATLVTAHADWRRGGFGLRALYAQWNLGGAAPALLGRDEQNGYYVEPSYRFETERGEIGFFGRYSRYDLEAGNGADSANEYFDLGVSYWPIAPVVLKADVQFARPANGSNDETVSLGVGYHF